jgi:hypothetical protein
VGAEGGGRDRPRWKRVAWAGRGGGVARQIGLHGPHWRRVVEGQRQHSSGRQFHVREVMTVPKSSASFALSMDSSSPPVIGTIAFGESCAIDCG